MRKVISYFLALIIMLGTVLLIASASFLFTFGQKSYYISKFDASTYIDACTNSIKNGIGDLGLASGIPSDAVAGAVSSKDIKSSLNQAVSADFAYIDGHASSISSAVDTNALSSKLNSAIGSYAKSNNIALSGSTLSAVKDYIARCNTIFSSNLIQIPYFNTIASVIRKALKIGRLSALLSVIFLLVLIAIVFGLPGRHEGVFQRLRYSLYGLSCGAVLTALLSAVVLVSGVQYHVNFTVSAVRLLVGSLVSGIFVTALILSLILLAVCILCFIVGKIVRGRQGNL